MGSNGAKFWDDGRSLSVVGARANRNEAEEQTVYSDESVRENKIWDIYASFHNSLKLASQCIKGIGNISHGRGHIENGRGHIENVRKSYLELKKMNTYETESLRGCLNILERKIGLEVTL